MEEKKNNQFIHKNLYTITKVKSGMEDQSFDTMLLEAVAASRNRISDHDEANPPFCGVIRTERDFNQLIELCGHTTDSIEQLLEKKALEKWIFAQGGKFSYETLTKNLPCYFDTVHVDQTPDDASILAAEYLRKVCYLDRFSLRQIQETNSRRLYSEWKGDHRSSGGLTYLGDRRTPGVARLAIGQAVSNLYFFDLAIAGMRLKDHKYRNIFMDSFANYFREAAFLMRIFTIWRELPFDSNKGDIRCAHRIGRFKAKASYAGDYKAMDQHHSYDATVKVCWLLKVWFDIPTPEIGKLIFWFKDLFDQAVLVGDEIWVATDSDNLLSGLYPTHDFEGITNILILTELVLSYGLRIVTDARMLKHGEVAIMVCGDDSIVLFGDSEIPADFPARHAEIAAKYGQIVDLDSGKIEIFKDTASFCKKHYALTDNVAGFKTASYEDFQYKVPKYSIRKAINSLRHPENMPKFPNYHDLIIWFCVIMDNVAGNQLYKQVVKVIIDKNPDLFNLVNLQAIYNYEYIIPDDVSAELKKDWWLSQVWDASFLFTSPTLKLLSIYINK